MWFLASVVACMLTAFFAYRLGCKDGARKVAAEWLRHNNRMRDLCT